MFGKFKRIMSILFKEQVEEPEYAYLYPERKVYCALLSGGINSVPISEAKINYDTLNIICRSCQECSKGKI